MKWNTEKRASTKITKSPNWKKILFSSVQRNGAVFQEPEVFQSFTQVFRDIQVFQAS